MVSSWGLWRPFPNHESGGYIEAPIGPGVYEVRHAGTGELVAFDSAGSVAQALSKLTAKPATGLRALFASKQPIRHRSEDLEYRTCSASTIDEAKFAAERLRGRREAFWRRHAPGWA